VCEAYERGVDLRADADAGLWTFRVARAGPRRPGRAILALWGLWVTATTEGPCCGYTASKNVSDTTVPGESS
jgi:hypothetical protein